MSKPQPTAGSPENSTVPTKDETSLGNTVGAAADMVKNLGQFQPQSSVATSVIETTQQLVPGVISDTYATELVALSEEMSRTFFDEILPEATNVVEEMLGPKADLKTETMEMEVEDEAGNVSTLPYETKTRSLRDLASNDNRQSVENVMLSEEFGRIYDEGMSADPLLASKQHQYFRIYQGLAAREIMLEMRSIVLLKGGDWTPAQTGQRIANAIALRGLDLHRGLKENTNKKYDDTMFVCVETGEQDNPGVFEFRITTESASEKRGVGRLDAKQVKYIRGLHRGKDAGYRLEGNAASGSRKGMTGVFQILGANIHSAYAGRQLDSDSTLTPQTSLGCQVIAASKSAFESDFVSTFDKLGVRSFNYTIVEDEELRLFAGNLSKEGKRSVLVDRIQRAATETAQR